jgi:hypothetical protein
LIACLLLPSDKMAAAASCFRQKNTKRAFEYLPLPGWLSLKEAKGREINRALKLK